MGYRKANGPNGEVKYFRTARDNEGNQQFLEISKDDIPPAVIARLHGETYTPPDTSTQQGRRSANMNRSQAQRANQKQATWEEIVQRGGPVAAEMKRNARAMPFWQKFPVQAMLETQKLGAGLADIGDFLDDATPDFLKRLNPTGLNLMAMAQGEKDPLQRTVQRRKEQAEKDAMDRFLHQEAGLAGTGAAVPYLISGRYASKPFESAADVLLNAPVKAASETVKATGRGLGGLVRRTARSRKAPRPVRQAASEIEETIMNPFNEFAAAYKARPDISFQSREGLLSELGGSAILGGLEGAAHYDNSMLEGAGSSLLGTGAGRFLGRYLEPAKVRTSPQEKETMKWWEKEGFRTDAGMRSGQPMIQARIGDMRYDPKYSPYMSAFDEANNTVITDVAGRAAGFKKGEIQGITSERLNEHMDNLKREYQSLEAQSRGRFTNSDLTELSNDLASTISKKEYKKIAEDYNKITDIIQTQARDKRGRLGLQSFSGTDYQRVRKQLKKRQDEAFKKDKRVEADAYTRMIDFMDKSLERGMEVGGKVDPKLWRDLNERYAMSKMLMQKGMTPNGNIDASKLSNFLMSSDAERLLREQGGRIKEFQQIAKLQDLKSKQKSGKLGMSSVDDESRAPYEITPMSTPNKLEPSFLNEKLTQLQLAGVPLNTGLLGWMPGYNKGTTPAILRAGAQASGVQNPTLSMIEWLMSGEAGADASNKLNELNPFAE